MLEKPSKITTIQWQYLIITAVYLLVILLSYHTTVVDLHTHWITPDDQEAGYVLLIIAIANGFFSIGTLKPDRRHTSSHTIIALFITALFSAVCMWLSLILDIKTISIILLITGWLLFIGLSLGLDAAAKIILPTMLIGTALPSWYLLTPILQALAVDIAPIFTQPMNIPMLIRDSYIHIPNGIIHVAQGCSGLKYLQTSVALSILLLMLQPIKHRYIPFIIGLSVLLALFTNWVRISILIVIGHKLGVDHAIMQSHDWLGWLVYIMMLPLWLYAVNRPFLQRQPAKQHRNPAVHKDYVHKAFYQPINKYYLLAVIIIWSMPALLPSKAKFIGNEQMAIAVFPTIILDYTLVKNKSNNHWKPNYSGYNVDFMGKYLLMGQDLLMRQDLLMGKNLGPHQAIDALALGYTSEQQGRELISRTNEVLTMSEYAELSYSTDNTEQWNIEQGISLTNGLARIVFYRYQLGDYSTPSALNFKIHQARYLLATTQMPMIVLFSTHCKSDCDIEKEKLSDIVEAYSKQQAFKQQENQF